MTAVITNWDQTHAQTRLRARRKLRLIIWLLVLAITSSIIIDHLRTHGDDWLRFNGHRVQFVKAVDGQSIAITDNPDGDVTIVALRGIRSAGPEWDSKSADKLEALLAGTTITLSLKSTDPRDPTDRLVADVFTQEHLLVSAELAGEGLTLADRNSDSDFSSPIKQAQAKARKRHLGLWANSRD
jgi:endonuclease YncB( thermonuclease family)